MDFWDWWILEPHRRKYAPDHSATLAAREAWQAAKEFERERCAKLCDEARDAIWPYHEPVVLNAACTVCENLANRIRGTGA